MNPASVFRLNENHKFTIIALRGANIDRDAAAHDLALEQGLWVLGHPPVRVDATWQKWLGTLQASKLNESNLIIVATAPSACPFVLDGENQALERQSLDLLIALGLAGLWFDGPGMILNGCQLDAQATEPTQVRQVHDTAWYRRLHHAVPPSLNREDLVRASALAAPISTLLQQKGNRLLKGLSAAHKGLEGRYGDERLHQVRPVTRSRHAPGDRQDGTTVRPPRPGLHRTHSTHQDHRATTLPAPKLRGAHERVHHRTPRHRDYKGSRGNARAAAQHPSRGSQRTCTGTSSAPQRSYRCSATKRPPRLSGRSRTTSKTGSGTPNP